MTEVVGILLAAGSASRFGGPKLMQPLPNGKPVAMAAAGALLQALPRAVAVVRPGDQALIEAFSGLGMKVVENLRADEGMGTSLATGVAAAAEADGWLIALADMPWIRPATIGLMLDRLEQGASMVAPVYKERRGHPVGFAARWRPELLALSGDQGARDLLRRHTDELVLVDTDDAGVLADIDLPRDLVVHDC